MTDNVFTGTAFYKALGEHKLLGTRCTACGALHLPPRPICPQCLSSAVEWHEFGGQGKLLAFSTVYIAPTAMIAAGYSRTNPYVAGIVQLAEGPSISAQILGLDPTKPESIAIGAPLTLTFVERGEGEAKKTFLAFQA
jgi:hypothetical protein